MASSSGSSGGNSNSSNSLVKSLMDLANAAKGVLNQDAIIKNVSSSDNSDNNDQALRSLFRGGKAMSEHHHRNSSSARNNSSFSSSAGTTSSGAASEVKRIWGMPPKAAKYRKLVSGKSKAKKVIEMVKDVFFITNPDINTVPRRNERQQYYINNLVASAVKFHSEMDAFEIKQEISCRFSQFNQLLFPEFEFLKAIDDCLVQPNVEEWDFKTLKHMFGQGPIYIRSINKIKTKYELIAPCSLDELNEDSDDNNYLNDDKAITPAPPKDTKKHPKINNVPKIIKDVCNENIAGSSRIDNNNTILNYYQRERSLDCPICFNKFPYREIESHAQLCAGKFDLDEFELDVDTGRDPTDEFDETFAYDDCAEVEADHEYSKKGEEKKDVKDILNNLKHISSSNIKLVIRLKRSWEDYINYLKKPWMKQCCNYTIEFLGETGVDTGGLKRQFFTGK